MARPVRHDDDAVLDRIATSLATRTSLQPWTLAEVSPAAGLSPAGLIKRFGSRRGILMALSRRWIDAIPTAPVGGTPPREELRAWARSRFGPADAHATAQGLTQLVDDLVDTELRALLAEGWSREIRYVAALLTAMEPRPVQDPLTSAGVLVDALNGAMLRRAADPSHDTVTTTLDTLMEHWT